MPARLFEKYHYWVVDYKYPTSHSYEEFSGCIGKFYLELNQHDDDVRGLSIESDFNYPNSERLIGAQLEGSLKNERLEILKTYLPWTGMSHSILFIGRVNYKSGLIVGTWSAPNTVPANLKVGSFEMYLDEGDFYRNEVSSFMAFA